MGAEQLAAILGNRRLRASAFAAKVTGLSSSTSQMDSFLMFANLSGFLVLFLLLLLGFFSYFFISLLQDF